MVKKSLILVSVLAFQLFCHGVIFAESKVTPLFAAEQGKNTYKTNPQPNVQKYSSYQECIAGFSLADLDYGSMAANDRIAVNDCAYCQAVLHNDIKDCNKLQGEGKITCSENFNMLQGFFLKILSSDQQTASMDMILSGVKAKFGNAKECKQFIDTILSKDVKRCAASNPAKASQCAALIELNENLAKDKMLADIIIYAKALKNLDAGTCNYIKDSALRTACKANLDGEEKTCINESGYAGVRENFCRSAYKK
ncbi:MAG: hypothetical protein NTY47_02445 [Candidatus Omnitrophica bacterium]|nr:hypothetical protein [Candidatus Omnitrophota bacterium]